MNKNVYSIKDTLGQVWYMPSYFPNDDTAKRMFGDLCLDKETPLGQHPTDYVLFKIGTWDDSTGELSGQVPEVIAHGHSIGNPSAVRAIAPGKLNKKARK